MTLLIEDGVSIGFESRKSLKNEMGRRKTERRSKQRLEIRESKQWAPKIKFLESKRKVDIFRAELRMLIMRVW